MRKTILALALATPFAFAQLCNAEELDAIFKRVNEMVTAKNYSKALDELSWAKKEIEKLHTVQLQTFLPEKLGGYTGEKVQSNSALGFMEMSRVYKKAGDEASVVVALTGGAAGSGGAGLGGLAALGQMAAMMGQQQGQDTVRVAGRTAQLQVDEDNKRAELVVFLNSGSLLKLEMQNAAKGDILKSMAEELKINDLDNYLKG